MDRAPDFRLLAVLVSAVPLSPALSLALLQAARALVRGGGGVQQIAGDRGELIEGRVWKQGGDALVGTLGGPLFEAQVETARGGGRVRFLVTHEGLEEGGDEGPQEGRAGPPRSPRALLN